MKINKSKKKNYTIYEFNVLESVKLNAKETNRPKQIQKPKIKKN